ncbi:MAG: sulfur carrier protein ThiS [Syntrophorhabdus sp.]
MELETWNRERFCVLFRMQIEIVLNGFRQKIARETSIAGLIALSGEHDRNLIVERNSRFVHPHTYDSIILQDGDRVEFINPDFGG